MATRMKAPQSTPHTDRHELTLVEALENEIIVKVVAGAFHSMALDFNGNVYAFGRSDQGQLGIDTRMPNQEKIPFGAFESIPKIVVFPGEEPVLISDVACVDNHSLALNTENEVYSWGFGDTGPTGHVTEDDEDIIVPTKLDLSTDGQQVLTYQIAAVVSIRSLSPSPPLRTLSPTTNTQHPASPSPSQDHT